LNTPREFGPRLCGGAISDTDSTARILESRTISPVHRPVLFSTKINFIRYFSECNLFGSDDNVGLEEVFLQILAEFAVWRLFVLLPLTERYMRISYCFLDFSGLRCGAKIAAFATW
jgi:hypothetical protein